MIVVLGLIILIIIVTTIILSVRRYKKYIYKDKDILKEYDSIVVLGAGVRADGKPCDILADRLKTAVDVYKKDEDKPIILSGDHGSDSYNEVSVMRDYVIKYKVPRDKIFLDHAGFCTYDTIYRAKEVFKVEKPILITNRYHLPRALYVARRLGLDAYGVESDLRGYDLMDKYLKREVLAQAKDFIYINILRPKPRFLGDSIPIKTSDGKVTDDNK